MNKGVSVKGTAVQLLESTFYSSQDINSYLLGQRPCSPSWGWHRENHLGVKLPDSIPFAKILPGILLWTLLTMLPEPCQVSIEDKKYNINPNLEEITF